MTLDELMASLPNGFHDSELHELALDFARNEARLILDVWVGDLKSQPGPEREKYRKGELRLSNLGFWISEPPQPSEFPLVAGSICIDIGPLRENWKPSVALPEIQNGVPIHWIYANDLNSCTYFTAESASLLWL